MQRVKYPLTDGAKEAARHLVDLWRSGKVNQYFTLIDVTSGSAKTVQTTSGLGILDNESKLPSIDLLLELSRFKLIDVEVVTKSKISSLGNEMHNRSWYVLLMQELLNAVDNDFEVSDFFLTTQAVGTIIMGDNNQFAAPVLGAASVYGDVSQTISSSELAEKLIDTLGQGVLQSQSELAQAIAELAKASQQEQQSKLGKVISELGRCLQHGANTVVVTQALLLIAPQLQHLIQSLQ